MHGCCPTTRPLLRNRQRSIRRKKTKFFFAIKSSKRTRRNSARISLPTWKIERRRTATAKKQESADGHQGQQLFQGQEVREIFGALYGCAKGHPIWCEDLKSILRRLQSNWSIQTSLWNSWRERCLSMHARHVKVCKCERNNHQCQNARVNRSNNWGGDWYFV